MGDVALEAAAALGLIACGAPSDSLGLPEMCPDESDPTGCRHHVDGLVAAQLQTALDSRVVIEQAKLWVRRWSFRANFI